MKYGLIKERFSRQGPHGVLRNSGRGANGAPKRYRFSAFWLRSSVVSVLIKEQFAALDQRSQNRRAVKLILHLTPLVVLLEAALTCGSLRPPVLTVLHVFPLSQ